MRRVKSPHEFRAAIGVSTALGGSLLLASCSSLPCRPDEGAPQEARAHRISKELEHLRELQMTQPVPVSVMTKAELRTVLEEELEKDWEEEGAGLERAYKCFGLIPAEIDLKPWLRDFMQSQIAGFYHVEKKAFFTVETETEKNTDPAVENFILAHELTHAIEDQHFDFEGARKRMKGQEDAQAAFESLIEGSAMEVGIEHTIWRQGAPLSTAGCLGRVLAGLAAEIDRHDLSRMAQEQEVTDDNFAQAPPFIQASLIFPYLKGWRLVNGIRSEFGWRAVDEAYRDPPESSEQVIHPERYVDRRDRPVRIALAEPPAGFEAKHEGTLGMLGVQILFEVHVARKAGRYAEGWDGDRYVLWNTPSGEALGWVSVWDRTGQAARFEKQYRRLLERRGKDPASWAVQRDGLVVAVVQGAPATAEAEAAATRLMTSQITRSPDDATPATAFDRLLLWPISVRPLDRVWEIRALGGRLIDTRFHGGGYRLRLADSLLLHSERSPDRFALWSILGLVGGTVDRTLDFSYVRVPFVLNGHRRGPVAGEESRAQFSMALGTLAYARQGARRQVSLLWGLLFKGIWGGEGSAQARVLFVPIMR